MQIRRDDLTGDATRALVVLHLAGMQAGSPPESVFALDVSGLQTPDITVWTIWRGDAIAGMAALREIGDGTGELKSMRTHPDHLRTGAASRLLDHIIAEAKARGLTRLSLETGRGEAFEPALSLSRKRGFVPGSAFGTYPENDFSQFFHLDL